MAKKVAFSVIINDLTGEVEEIKTSKRFEEEGALFRMDVLKDAIEVINKVYDYEKEIFFSKWDNTGIA